MIETIGPHFGITRPSGRVTIHEEKADGTDLSQFNAHYRDSSGMHSSDSVDYAIVTRPTRLEAAETAARLRSKQATPPSQQQRAPRHPRETEAHPHARLPSS